MSTLRVSGNSVVMPAMSRVIGCGSYCCTIGTWGPIPNSCPIGLSSMTRSSPSVKPYLASSFFTDSGWLFSGNGGLIMASSLPPRPRYASSASISGGKKSLRGPAMMTTEASSGTLPCRASASGLAS